jgi:hypothetical protein
MDTKVIHHIHPYSPFPCAHPPPYPALERHMFQGSNYLEKQKGPLQEKKRTELKFIIFLLLIWFSHFNHS